MMAMAAREMGYRVRVLDPDPECAARSVVEEVVTAAFDDVDAARDLASRCDVMTLEIEKVSTRVLDAVASVVPMRPGAHALRVIQDRVLQREFLVGAGLPVGPFRVATTKLELSDAIDALGGRTFVKAATGGYDGRGQFQTTSRGDAEPAWASLVAPGRESDRLLVEQEVAIEKEISVMVARRPSGDVAAYPAAENHHVDRILAWSTMPARIPAHLARQAEELARGAAEALRIEGLLCAELFVIGGTLLVNELAPRPHNSYHASAIACGTSQFEQAVRAACDLPLGSTAIHRPAAIVNLLGDAWAEGPPPFDRALELPGVRVHLYGKAPRPGRKMGHVSACGSTTDEAVTLVQRAEARLLRRED
jgi:5-(carboxyamino)imidazole ribonucleotide synthase